MTCDHGMMLMNDHDDAYVDAMLMVNMQANTRSVTDYWGTPYLYDQGLHTWSSEFHYSWK